MRNFVFFGGPETVRMDAVGHDVIITGNKRCVWWNRRQPRRTRRPRESGAAANGLLSGPALRLPVHRKTNTQDSSITKERNQESDEWTTKRRTTREKKIEKRRRSNWKPLHVCRLTMAQRQMSWNIFVSFYFKFKLEHDFPVKINFDGL